MSNSPLLTIVAGEEGSIIAPPPALAPATDARPKSRAARSRAGARAGNIALGLLFPAALLALWWWASDNVLLPATILPGPWVVFATFKELVETGDLQSNLAISLFRVAKGFALGSVLGLSLGFALGFSAPFERWIGPTFRTLAQVPSLAWIPLLMQIFGIDDTLKLVVMAKAALIPIAFTTAAGVRNIPASYREVGKVLRLRPLTMLLRVILPGALPSIFSGMRQGLAHVWVSLIIVEMLASAEGIGYLMSWGRTIFQLDIVMVGIVVIGIVGFSLDLVLRLLETRFLRWEGKRR
jgi:sulfonate transport system permease protein